MSNQDDDTQNYALAVIAGIVALVVAGVIALAASTAMHKRSAAAAGAAATAPVEALGPGERLYFEVGSDALPADANEALARVAEAARANVAAAVLISGFHDASGDPETNAELAKNRALAVRHALEANGVEPQRLLMSKPSVTTGGADPREARRVEVRLQ